MELNLSNPVNDENGNPIIERDQYGNPIYLKGKDGEIILENGLPQTKPLPLFHFVRFAVMNQLEADPKTLDFNKKLHVIFTKLDKAKETKKVNFKPETITFLRERMIQCKLHLLVMVAFNELVDGDVSEATLDSI
jgi:hypothetical protein